MHQRTSQLGMDNKHRGSSCCRSYLMGSSCTLATQVESMCLSDKDCTSWSCLCSDTDQRGSWCTRSTERQSLCQAGMCNRRLQRSSWRTFRLGIECKQRHQQMGRRTQGRIARMQSS
jgi:hypothetical protein